MKYKVFNILKKENQNHSYKEPPDPYNVVIEYEDGKFQEILNLGKWCCTQRAAKRAMDNKKKFNSVLTQNDIKQLDSIKFHWNPRNLRM